MANNTQYPDWDDLGRSIQEAVDRAVGSRDFEKLNQTISNLAGKAVDMSTQAVRKGVENVSRPKPEYKIAKPNVPQEKPKLPAVYAKTGGLTAWGVVKTAVGCLFLFLPDCAADPTDGLCPDGDGLSELGCGGAGGVLCRFCIGIGQRDFRPV